MSGRKRSEGDILRGTFRGWEEGSNPAREAERWLEWWKEKQDRAVSEKAREEGVSRRCSEPVQYCRGSRR